MKWQSIVAIYILFWVMSAFVVLPFGVRTHDEAGVPRVKGQAESAPVDFRIWRIVGRTTLVASIVFALFYANYLEGWVTTQDLAFIHPPEMPR